MDAHHRKTQQQESRATADCRGNKLLNETAGIEMHQSEFVIRSIMVWTEEKDVKLLRALAAEGVFINSRAGSGERSIMEGCCLFPCGKFSQTKKR